MALQVFRGRPRGAEGSGRCCGALRREVVEGSAGNYGGLRSKFRRAPQG